MTDYIEELALRLRENPDRAFSVFELGEEFGLSRDAMSTTLERLAKRDAFFDLGHGRMMFTNDSHRVAFEIFRTEAPNISYEEYVRYRDEPHILMRMSRDRDVAGRLDPEKRLQGLTKEKEKTRGNRF